VKITVRCRVPDGGRPCGKEVGTIDRPGFSGSEWYRDSRLRWEERHHVCPKHGALQVHEEDMLRLTLNPDPPVIMAPRSGRIGDPDR
jgi:hypothetical protein